MASSSSYEHKDSLADWIWKVGPLGGRSEKKMESLVQLQWIIVRISSLNWNIYNSQPILLIQAAASGMILEFNVQEDDSWILIA